MCRPTWARCWRSIAANSRRATGRKRRKARVVNPNEVMLNFSPPEGTAVLKLGHKYDLTTVSLVQQITETGRQSSRPTGRKATRSRDHETGAANGARRHRRCCRERNRRSGAVCQRARRDIAPARRQRRAGSAFRRLRRMSISPAEAGWSSASRPASNRWRSFIAPP